MVGKEYVEGNRVSFSFNGVAMVAIDILGHDGGVQDGVRIALNPSQVALQGPVLEDVTAAIQKAMSGVQVMPDYTRDNDPRARMIAQADMKMLIQALCTIPGVNNLSMLRAEQGIQDAEGGFTIIGRSWGEPSTPAVAAVTAADNGFHVIGQTTHPYAYTLTKAGDAAIRMTFRMSGMTGPDRNEPRTPAQVLNTFKDTGFTVGQTDDGSPWVLIPAPRNQADWTNTLRRLEPILREAGVPGVSPALSKLNEFRQTQILGGKALP